VIIDPRVNQFFARRQARYRFWYRVGFGLGCLLIASAALGFLYVAVRVARVAWGSP
jgi:hypothetical protein